MLRWKLFIPLAVILTAAGLLGSYFWSTTASTRYLSALNNQAAADVSLDGKGIIVNFKSGQALASILEELDSDEMAKIAAGKSLKFTRGDQLPIESNVVTQVELIVAQAVATREYYQASVHLEELATGLGYDAELVIWQGMIVAEIRDSEYSYIAHSQIREVMAP